MKNEQIVLNQYPEGIPNDQTFKYENIDVQTPKNGELQIESLYISVDPYMRGRMTPSDSYVQPFKLNQPIIGHVLARVVVSKSDDFTKGDIVIGMLPWKRFHTLPSNQVDKVPSTDVPLELYLSTLGMTGQTAYHGLLDIGRPKAGETVVVSAASGAVGAVVGQIAKIKGARVVGIAGGTKKVNYLTETLGFDAGIDYKKDDFAEALASALPDGVDVYFENVGGAISDEVFKHLNRFARIPVCGAISSYNHPERDIGPRIQGTLIKKQAMMRGFLVAEFSDTFKEASEQLAQWVKEGKIKTEVSIAHGFHEIPTAFKNLFTGDNFGKQIVKVSE
ncbi:NADP-dependent oxidoreductase [Staphylococcus lugdunensis]|uniref:NADP-dependent oxidoreductase n=1 Tax=Staphylococcus lugdunensis TaxID=28035 RepID=A0A4V2KVX1_STALU|nr:MULTISPECIES: NADP-dependent oxidoreductase [Staphylococcus]AMG62404.1 NADP-dependent oxidoreductase [Staphylococcus lugdunensis]ARJ10934.1 NADP-dependent oxidoreductase [Staphylococcus lugdunensis]AST60613.1 NADP-dependent oxidoreductase [Staphylococcus lugdunensis]ATG68351.1 NADP-dependent oxidoreductase [Staphylococcus lugdunensis]ATN15900.1 NADP-dependent oxidoreductase [Staphylococcus lugdunensis]